MASQTQESPMNVPEWVTKELNELQTLWCRDKNLNSAELEKRYCSITNPYSYFMEILYNGSDSQSNVLSEFMQHIVQHFKNWLNGFGHAHRSVLKFDFQVNALNKVMEHNNCAVIFTICEVFEMREAGLVKFTLDNHLSLHKYKQVCYAITALGLQDFYSIEEIVYPLICQNEINHVYHFVENNREMQIQCVKNLDAVYKSEASVAEMVRVTNVECKHKTLKRNKAWLKKILTKFVQRYNIPLEVCPNLVRSRRRGALFYVYQQRFKEANLSADAWMEMTINSIGDDQTLVRELLFELIHSRNMKSALEIAELYNVPSSEWPHPILFDLPFVANTAEQKSLYHSRKALLMDEGIQFLNIATNYLTLQSGVDIILICTPEQLTAFLSRPYDVVGIDAEWRLPVCFEPELISILQIATWDCVYILDIKVLLKVLDESHWQSLVEKIFCNENVLKIGYGLQKDFILLRNIWSNMSFKINDFPKILDLSKFYTQFVNKYPVIKSHFTQLNGIKVDDDHKGLSKLCHVILGKPLNKMEQCSDWDRRPLRDNQVIYAGLDAGCLIQIYEKLLVISESVGLEFLFIIEEFLERGLQAEKPA